MKITGINEQLSSHNQNMGARYFELDGVPDTAWTDFFTSIHQQSFDLMKRNVRVQNTWVIVECPLDEMQHQINFLNEICDKATKAVENAKMKAEENETQRLASEAERKKNASAYFSTLKFDKD